MQSLYKFLFPTLLGIFLTGFSATLSAQTDLNPGDILFTLVNMDGNNDDAFGFVLLTDVEAGTEVFVTDNEWDPANGFTADSEGTLRITFVEAFTCGTEVIVTDQDPENAVYTFGTDTPGIRIIQEEADEFQLTSAGETLIMYDGDNINLPCNTCFITALANTGVDFGVTATGSGPLPPGLVVGQSAMVMRTNEGAEFDNIKYNCSVTQADPMILSMNLLNPDNWLGSDDMLQSTDPCSPAFSCSAPDPLQVTVFENTPILCNGGSEGSLVPQIANGTEPFTYQWSNGFTERVNPGLSAGPYSVTVTDANGATGEGSFTLTEPTLLTALTVVDSNVTCNGVFDGGATAAGSGGTMPYSYLWNNGATTAAITGVGAGTYSVTVTDANGCEATSSATITEPMLLMATTVVDSNVTCNGFADGGASASAAGGTISYSYRWSNGATTAAITGVMAGTYSVTVTDANGCEATSSATITEPAPLTVSFTTGGLEVAGDAGAQTGLGGGMPVGGTYSGPGVTDDGNGMTYTFDPTGLELGETTVTYTFTDGNGCAGSATDVITVVDGLDGCTLEETRTGGRFNINETADMGQPFIACDSGRVTQITLELFEGPARNFRLSLKAGDNTLDATFSQEVTFPGLGVYTIEITDPFYVLEDSLYSFSLRPTDGGTTISRFRATNTGLNSSPLGPNRSFLQNGGAVTPQPVFLTTTIVIERPPVVVSLGAFAGVCADAGVQTGLGGGMPTGGTYAGPGVTDDGNGMTFSFDPAAAGAGVQTVSYTVPGITATSTLEVFALPTVTMNTGMLQVEANAGAQTGLGGGLPFGGAYSGPGVTDDGNGMTYTFDPTGLELGETTVTYTFTDVNGCAGSATDVITVTEAFDGCRLEQPEYSDDFVITLTDAGGQRFIACTTGRVTEISLNLVAGAGQDFVLAVDKGAGTGPDGYDQTVTLTETGPFTVVLDTAFAVLEDSLYSFTLIPLSQVASIQGAITDDPSPFGEFAFLQFDDGSINSQPGVLTAEVTIVTDSTVVSTRTPRAAVAEMIAYPNPARGSFTVAYTLAEATELELILFDAQGRLLRQQRLGRQLAGENTLRVDAANLPAGIIAYGLRGSNGRMLVKRMVLME
ncbi:hypothetical protein [Lewinella sp. W8]|uniref:hypothetical protein n=1 Tax=Lewinella sp. W8 TaxID=2528208 RepID=UPI0010671D32|nr:hypothetical protein [Lewinella sp. W8]MTB53318.1 hypothetical protein [Lewinella sp. W8]